MARKNKLQAIGDSFEDLNAEEMAAVQGAGDTEAETVTVAISEMAVGAATSRMGYSGNNK